ncbi:MAG: Poly(3-hydroxyalkanoate) polymerase subunit PhaC [Gammaproteobacteria bacterium]|nr:Poly(3-hydroxyalkanoate) polymerase subunit PhaC [Gammaproteobacteria bacterium]
MAEHGRTVPFRPPVGRRSDLGAGERSFGDIAMEQIAAILEAEPEEERPHDAFLHADLARITQGISPIAVGLAYLDWLAHLLYSPDKQHLLARKSIRKLTRLALYIMSLGAGGCRCIEPLPQDKRFNHPGWNRWPYNVISQSFLLTQQWWWNATTDVRGMARHHEHVVSFMTRQWLDVFSPSNFVPTNPEVLLKTYATLGMNLVRGARNFAEDVLRQAAHHPPAGADAYQVGGSIAVTPGKVIFRNRLIELIQYEPSTPEVRPEPVLIVPSWIMKYYILDLSPENSLVRHLVENGYTVFMISWKNPGTADRDIGMDGYLREGILTAIDLVAKVLPRQKIHTLGYCLGGTLLGIAAAMHARESNGTLGSLTFLASTFDFTEPGELELFIDESQIAFLEDIMWTRGFLDGKEMAGAFAMLNSKDLVWSKMVRDYLMGERARLTDLMAWNADATRLPYRMHTEYLRKLYLRNELAEGHFEVGGRPVALTDIRQPIFVVGTERDHVSPWRSVYKAHLLTDTEITFVLTTGGHNVGIVNPPGKDIPGRGYRVATSSAEAKYVDPDIWSAQATRCEGSWWPAWIDWLNHRSGEPVAPPAMGAPNLGLLPLDNAPGRYVLKR